MPTHFVKIDDFGNEVMPFNRFHYNEATGERAPTKEDHPDDVFELTDEQAIALVVKRNQTCDLFGYDFWYAVYSEKS